MEAEKQITVQLPETWAADWTIVSRLGSGSYSTVYRAVRKDHPGLDAAIKVISIPANESEADTLKTEGLSDHQSQQYYDDIARQYIAEIEIMESLKGTQNIVGIEDYKVVRLKNTIGNRIFIRMELLRSLDSVYQQRVFTEQELIHLGMDICSALEFCEAKQIIHRDIKPANIFINDKTPGHVFYKLGDFGIAKNMELLTHGLSTKGTPAYMAPEVLLRKPYDCRADLYSLGITLYRLLNGNRLPFVPTNGYTASIREEAMNRRLAGEPLPPPAGASPALARVILKACAYRPEDRYPSAAEMRRDLENILRGTETQTVSFSQDEETVYNPLPDLSFKPVQTPDSGTESVFRPDTEIEADRLEETGQETVLLQESRSESTMLPNANQPAEPLQQQPETKRKAPAWRWAILAAAIVALGAAVYLLFLKPKEHTDPVEPILPTASIPAEEPAKTAEQEKADDSVPLDLPTETEGSATEEKEAEPEAPAETETLSATEEQKEAEKQPQTENPEEPEKTVGPEMTEEPEEHTEPEQMTETAAIIQAAEELQTAAIREEAEPEQTAGNDGENPEETPGESGVQLTSGMIILMVDHPEVQTHQGFTYSGFAPGARHLRMEVLDETTGELQDWREAEGGVMEATFSLDHTASLYAILIADYDDGEEPRRSDPVKTTVTADGSTGPLTITADPVIKTGKPIIGKVYAEQTGWYHIWIERIDNQHTYLTEYDLQPDTSGYASFFIEPGLLEQNGVYSINAAAYCEGKNSTYSSINCMVSDITGDEHPVSLTIENETGDNAFLAYQEIDVQIDAPGAQAIRVLCGDHWEVECDRDSMSRQWRFGEGRQLIIAEAAYDPVDWSAVDWSTFNPDQELAWQGISNPIRLEFYAPYGQADAARVTMDAGRISRGTFLEATLSRPSNTPGAEYSLWLDIQREENGETFWDYRVPVDWYEDHGLLSTLSLEAGHYRLNVETHAPGYEATTVWQEAEFDLIEGEQSHEPEYRMLHDTMRTGEQNVFYYRAEGAERMELLFGREGDPYYREVRGADGEDGRWDLFISRADVYTLTPVAFYPQMDEQGARMLDEATGEPLSLEVRGEPVSLTVTADGDLSVPILSAIPVIVAPGDPIEIHFDLPEEATYSSVSVNRVSEEGDWPMVFYRDGDPEAVRERARVIPGDALSEPGLYRLSVYANAPGLNDVETGIDFLVLSGETGNKISLTLNGSREEEADGRAGEEIPLVISAPGADAIRLLDGNRNWQYFDRRSLNEKGEFFWWPSYNSGSYLFVVQSCDHTGIDWDTVDWNTFDWHTVNWTETSNAIRVKVTAEGQLKPPALTVPETCARGQWMEVEIEEVPHAEHYNVIVDRLNQEGYSEGPTLEWMDFMAPGKVLIPTAGLVEGERYGLRVSACAKGYNCGDTAYMTFSVTGDAPEEEYRIVPDHVHAGEPFLVSIWSPGAASVRLCHENLDNVWNEMPFVANTFVCNDPGDYDFRAYAYIESRQRWIQIGTSITVHVTAE